MGQPAGPVAVTLITSSPASLSADGGKLVVHGTVTGAKTCSMASTPDLGSGSVGCKDGTFRKRFTIPADSTNQPANFSFTLSASGAGGSASATLSLQQPVAAAPAVDILSLNASPASLPGAGTPSLTVSATLTGASQCTWTMDGGTPTAPETCTTSSSHNFGVIAANPGPGVASHSFELDVTGPGGTASETLTMSQPPVTAPGPTITSITPSPDQLTAAGGTLNIALDVTGASTCSITGDHGVGSVTGADCSSGSYNHDFTIPANNTGADITYTFDVTATSGANSATGSLSITQPAAVPPGPQVTRMTSSPATVRLPRRHVRHHGARDERDDLRDDEQSGCRLEAFHRLFRGYVHRIGDVPAEQQRVERQVHRRPCM